MDAKCQIDDETIEEFALGRREDLLEHVESCNDCQKKAVEAREFIANVKAVFSRIALGRKRAKN